MDYRYIKLGDCLSLITNGFVVKQSRDTDKAGGYPFTRIETLSNGRFNRDRMGYADIYDLKGLESYVLEDDDIIISHINSRRFLGRSVLYKKIGDEIILHGMNVLRIKTNREVLNPVYANYFFQTEYYKQCIDNIRKDAINQSSFSIGDFQKLVIPLPEIEYQEKIAGVLSSLDRKIALNRAINRNLEALAKQLYDYWFVQFDFPDENGRPYKSSGGKMVWDETLKREIPIAWKSGAFSDIANITMGQSPDGSSYNEKGEGIVFYQGSTDFGIRFPSVRMYTTSPSRYAKQGDILMSVRAPVGAVNIANSDCCIGRGLSAINSKKGSVTYIYYVIHYLKVRFDSLNTAGTTFGSITKEELLSLPVVIPSEKILERFEAICKPIFNKQMEIGFEIESLTRQRDELLPLLMNGQITVNSDL